MQDFRVMELHKTSMGDAWVRTRVWAQAVVWPEVTLQRPHIYLWSPFFLGLGIALYFALPFEPPLVLSVFLMTLPLLGWLFLGVHDFWRSVLLPSLCICIGFGCAALRTDFVHTPILQKEIRFAELEGHIRHVEHLPAGEGTRIVLENLDIEDLASAETPRFVRVKLRGSGSELRAGQTVKLLAGLNAPSPPVLPGGFDFQRYMYFKGIGAVGFSYGAPEVIDDGGRASFLGAVDNFRAHVVLKMVEALEDRGGVVSALMVGQRAGITEVDKEAMRDAGLAHMLAISGLHVGLFFGFVFFIVRLGLAYVPRLALNYPIKNYAAVVAMVAAVFYMLVAGMTIPTQRAVLMTAAVFVAILLERTPMSMRLVVFAAMVVLILFPESLISASFQMSFAAVAGLVAFYQAIKPYWSAWHRKAGFVRRVGLYIAGVCMTTVIATLATAPFALFHFQQLAIYSLLSNILAMPVLAFIVMPFVVLYFILLPFGLEGLAIPFLGWGVGLILDIAHYVAALEHSTVHAVMWPTVAIMVYTLGFLMLILFEGRLRVISMAPFVVFLLMICTIKQPDILVSSESKLFAVRVQDGSLVYSDLRSERFAREQWARSYGLEDAEPQKWPKEGAFGDLFCGEAGCRQETAGHKISYLRDLKAFDTACAWADILIAPDPVPSCEQAYVIDKFDTYRNGAYAIYLEGQPEGAARIVNVAQTRGNRPWVARAD